MPKTAPRPSQPTMKKPTKPNSKPTKIAAPKPKPAPKSPRPSAQSPVPSAISDYRTEKDSMGEMSVPADVLYGASTQRAVLNFPISGRPVPAPIIKAYALIKAAAAATNKKLKRLDHDRAQ